MPESWGVFVLLFTVMAIVFGVFWMYRREIDTCPMPIKLFMAGLRLATLLFLVALLATSLRFLPASDRDQADD